MRSARDWVCSSVNIAFKNEKTRSAAAEFGVKENTIRAAFAHSEKRLRFFAHHLSTLALKSLTELWSTLKPLHALRYAGNS